MPIPDILRGDTPMCESGGAGIPTINAGGGRKDVRYKTRYPQETQ